MFTICRSRLAMSVVVAVLAFALSAPIAVNAEDPAITEDQVLAAENRVPALVPVADASWDETSGYASVEMGRATTSVLLAPAATSSWDATSGYGAVERSRADAASSAEPTCITSLVPADVRWAPDASLTVRQTPWLEYLPAALASGRRTESAHLATVPLLGEDVLGGAGAAC